MTNEMTNPKRDRYIESSLDLDLLAEGRLISTASWWQRQNIRFKTTVLAIAIGTIPTIMIGSIAYYFANQSIAREIVTSKQQTATGVADKVAFFMRERYGDIQIMASLSILTDRELRSQTSVEAKQAALDQFIKAYGIYDSIAVFDLNGNVIAQSTGEILGNHRDRSYFQTALKTDALVLSQPTISKSSGSSVVYLAAPVKDIRDNTNIGVIRARMPVKHLRDVILAERTEKNYLLDNQGKIFATSDEQEYQDILNSETKNQPASDRFSIYPSLQKSSQKTTKIADKLLLSYIPFNNFQDKLRSQLPDLGWSTITTEDRQLVFAPQRQLQQVFIIGTTIVALGIGAIAILLAKRILRPLLSAASAVQEIGRGNLDARIKIQGSDEIAQLGDNINRMASQLADFVQIQALLAQQAEAIKNITLKLAIANEITEIIDLAVGESYQVLSPQGVIYYQFQSKTAGRVVSEFKATGLDTMMNVDIFSSNVITEYFTQHQEDKLQVEVINDLSVADLSFSAQQLQSLKAQASLIAPVVIDDKLDGLLIAYHSTNHTWIDREINLITQVANQMGLASTRLELVRQQKIAQISEKSAKEAIQSRALELLKEVYSAAEGDLTIKAKVTEDEIGTIADSYNSTIASVRKLVNQAKSAAIEVQNNTLANDLAVQELAQEARIQADTITQMLEQVKAMEGASNQVAYNAASADNCVKEATTTLNNSDRAMNQTVAQINAVKITVTETAAKAQKLGESSQEISQAVNLISRFAAQTHLLALKASIEAARAGEQGKGFAVIADEVRSLATQSAEATAEIETLVTKIQLDTNQVVEAMNQSTGKIVTGNELLQQTRQSLQEVSQVSEQISNLVSSITQATEVQSETSTQVSQAMVKVAAIAENNSQSATQVFTSIRELSVIAEKLQSSIDKFKT
ncbi:methyl-accepting chemotaxis sensory transducer with phytochrome sensor [Chondrocystis sp. NIES-4102]|nr:methyl-accepting chemotaxis sensory transducer with phytochrome sensor [Chondrocystis sp. NIES-4102]